MRSSRLKRAQMLEESSRPLYEQVQDFILKRGDVYILPYLDVYDRDRFGSGKFFYQNSKFDSLYELVNACQLLIDFQTNPQLY
jgi:hypothetical protein